MAKEIFTIKEVAEYLQVTERTLYRLAQERSFGASAGRTWTRGPATRRSREGCGPWELRTHAPAKAA